MPWTGEKVDRLLGPTARPQANDNSEVETAWAQQGLGTDEYRSQR